MVLIKGHHVKTKDKANYMMQGVLLLWTISPLLMHLNSPLVKLSIKSKFMLYKYYMRVNLFLTSKKFLDYY